jgi:hypothetical protein
MVVPLQNQQTKLGKSRASRLFLILQDVSQSVLSLSFIQFCSSIKQFNNTFFDNSMSTAGMEFFVPTVLVFVNSSKRDQVPASERSRNLILFLFSQSTLDPFQLVTW